MRKRRSSKRRNNYTSCYNDCVHRRVITGATNLRQTHWNYRTFQHVHHQCNNNRFTMCNCAPAEAKKINPLVFQCCELYFLLTISVVRQLMACSTVCFCFTAGDGDELDPWRSGVVGQPAHPSILSILQEVQRISWEFSCEMHCINYSSYVTFGFTRFLPTQIKWCHTTRVLLQWRCKISDMMYSET